MNTYAEYMHHYAEKKIKKKFKKGLTNWGLSCIIDTVDGARKSPKKGNDNNGYEEISTDDRH